MYLVGPDPCDVGSAVLCNPLMQWACNRICDGASTAVDSAQAAANLATDAGGLLKMIANLIADPLGGSVEGVLYVMFRWLLVPSIDTSQSSVAQTIQHSWMLPIAILFLTCGIIWQGFQMVISRRGEPLIRAVKAILATAAWGGIATAGSAAMLKAGDTYSCWVLGESLRGSDPTNQLIQNGQCVEHGLSDAIIKSQVADHLGNVLAIPSLLASLSGVGLILQLVIGLIILISALLQMFLFVVRGGSLIILVGVSQLAAAGTVTRSTSGWPKKLTAWMLALIMYKPVAATVYATALLFIDTTDQTDDNKLRNFLMGLTMLVLSVFAMPALMRFFNWGFSALGRDGTLSPFATGMDNLGDDAIRVGTAMKTGAKGQAKSIDSSLPQPVATVETQGMSLAGASAGAGGGGGGGQAAAAAGAGIATKTTVFAPPASGTAAAGGAAAAGAGAATAGVGLVVVGTAVGVGAAATQIGTSVKKGITDHMDEDNE